MRFIIPLVLFSFLSSILLGGLFVMLALMDLGPLQETRWWETLSPWILGVTGVISFVVGTHRPPPHLSVPRQRLLDQRRRVLLG